MSGTSFEGSSSNDGSSGKGYVPVHQRQIPFSHHEVDVFVSSLLHLVTECMQVHPRQNLDLLGRFLFLVEVQVPIQTVEIRYRYFVQKRFQQQYGLIHRLITMQWLIQLDSNQQKLFHQQSMR